MSSVADNLDKQTEVVNMKFEDAKKVLVQAIKAKQQADIQIAQLLLEFDLETLTEVQIIELGKLSEKQNDYQWRGFGEISTVYYKAASAKRAREEAAEAAAQIEEEAL
jgi:hypothetical protein